MNREDEEERKRDTKKHKGAQIGRIKEVQKLFIKIEKDGEREKVSEQRTV